MRAFHGKAKATIVLRLMFVLSVSLLAACGDDDGGSGACAGFGDCDGNGTCETDLTSADNCGACGVTCEDNAYCGARSICQCYPGFRRADDDACVPANEVVDAPVITEQPTSVSVAAGESATFRVTATGEGPLSYVWHYVTDDGSTGTEYAEAELVIDNVETGRAGQYWVVVSNVGGETESAHVRLNVSAVEICTAEELDTLLREDSNGSYVLTCDIDLATDPSGNDDPMWFAPLPYFTGTLDGAGHEISGFTYDDTTNGNVGLFSSLGGRVFDLTLRDFHVTTSDVGGALAGAFNAGWISNCAALDVQVTGDNALGGLVGSVQSESFISHARVTGTVEGTGYSIGGIAGTLYGATISHSRSDASVRGESEVGGVVGSASGRGRIANSAALGTVEGTYSAGGLVGGANRITIQHSYAAGAVTSGGSNGAGLVGYADRVVDIDSVWDTERSGQATSAAGLGVTTEELRNGEASVFDDWDRAQAWSFNADEDPVVLAGTRPSVVSITPSVLSPLGGETLTIELADNTAQVHVHTYNHAICVRDTITVDGNTLTCTTLPGSETETVVIQNADSTPSFPIELSRASIADPIALCDSGEGTEDDPCILRTASQLMAMPALISVTPLHVRLGADIDLSSTPATMFPGPYGRFVFDGDGHAIIGFDYEPPTTMYGDAMGYSRALFNYINDNSEVRNLVLRDFHVSGVQAAALTADNNGILDNIRVESSEVTGDSAALLAISSVGTISGCSVEGQVTGLSTAAGLVLNARGSITDSHAHTTMTSPDAGGLIGYLTADGQSETARVERCFADTEHTTELPYGSFGGLISSSGYMPSFVIVDSYALGISDASIVGGLIANVGSAGTSQRVERCFAAVETSSTDAGGIVGSIVLADDLTIIDCHWDQSFAAEAYDPSSGFMPTLVGAVGHATADMQMQSTFAEWDFTTVWQAPDNGYPTLR